MNNNKGKKKERLINPFTIKFTTEERERYDNHRKKHGYRTLAGFIRDSMEHTVRNPTVLEPTEKKKIAGDIDEILRQYEAKTRDDPTRVTGAQLSMETRDNTKQNRRDILINRALVEGLMRKMGMTKQEIKWIKTSESSGLVVFE